MADPNKDTDNNFVEIEGVKYKEDPENEGEALIGDNGEFVPFEEKEEETEEEKKEREEREEKEKEEENEEPPLRKSVKDHIINRQKEKIEKLKKKKDYKVDEEEVTEAGRNAIRKEIKDALAPVLDTVRTQSDEQELKDVFAKYPDAKKMEKQIRKYMASEGYKNSSVEFIYWGLAAKKMDLQKKRDKANEDAKADITGGHGRRKKKLSPIPDVRDLSDKDFDALVQKVKTGQT